MGKGGGRGAGKGRAGGDSDKVAAILVGLMFLALTIWIGGGLLGMLFGSCAVGACSDGSCWWGCECGYYSSDSPAYGVVGSRPGLIQPDLDTSSLDWSVPMSIGGSMRDVEVRIEGAESEGLLQVNIDGQGWDEVCDNSFGNTEARAACGTLGWSDGSTYDAYGYGDSFALDDLDCPSSASTFRECRTSQRAYSHNCEAAEAVGIRCSGSRSSRSTQYADTGCSNTCAYNDDGDCDDGGEDSDSSNCLLGTDCDDCGSRPVADQCPPGHLCSGGAFFVQDCATKDTLCEAGTYCAQAGCEECLPCETGTMCAAAGCAECEPCPSGHTSMPGATECSGCAAGTFSEVGVCIECPAGRFSNVGTASDIGCFACSDITRFTDTPLCHAEFLSRCSSNPGNCTECSGQSDCASGAFCNEAGVCDECANMKATSKRCYLMGGDCCSTSAITQCPEEVVSSECTFCRGDIMGCGFAFAVGCGWLGIVMVLSLLGVVTDDYGQKFVNSTGKASAVKIISLALFFLTPKACVVGVSLAHSQTEQFSGYSTVYPLMGFFIVASTMALAAACVFLPQMTSPRSRGLLAMLMTALHTILTVSVAVHVIIAGLFSSQREISLLHGCADLAQIFVLQMAAIYIAEAEPWVCFGAASGLLWDSGNSIFMALLGMWAPWPAAESGFLIVLGIWFLRQMLFGAIIKKVVQQPDLSAAHKSVVPITLGVSSAAMVTVTLLSSPGTPPGGYFVVCVGLVFIPNVPVSPIQIAYAAFAGGACWWALGSADFILLHIWLSALVGVFDYYYRVFKHDDDDNDDDNDNDNDNDASSTATLLPVLIHAMFLVWALTESVESNVLTRAQANITASTHVFDFVAVAANSSADGGDFGDDRSSVFVSPYLGIPLLAIDILYCIVFGWKVNQDRGNATTITKWLSQWLSLLTTGCLIGLTASVSDPEIKYIGGGILAVGAALLCFGGGNTVETSARAACVFVLIVDAVPVVFFMTDVAATSFDTPLDCSDARSADGSTSSADGSAALVPAIDICTLLARVYELEGDAVAPISIAVVCLFKACVCLWYTVFELKANWSNQTRTSWILESLFFASIWCFLLTHAILTGVSIVPAMNTLGKEPINGTHCVGVARPDALAIDTFRCASPADMLKANMVLFLGVAIMFMVLVGEGINQTRGDEDARWPDSWTAKVAENVLQLLLTAQVLYSMLRLRTQSDLLYVLFITLDLVWIFLLMLSRQFREGYGAVTYKDWGMMYVLEAWDVVNSLVVTVAIAQDTEHNWPTYIADLYVLFFVLTLFLFEVSYPFWTSLKRIAWISCFNDLATDGPMLYLMVVYELYDKSTVTAIAAFVNICIIAVGVVIWPLKYYIQEIMNEEDGVQEGVPPEGVVAQDDDPDVNDSDSGSNSDSDADANANYFCQVTGATVHDAREFLLVAGGDVQRAIQYYYDAGHQP